MPLANSIRPRQAVYRAEGPRRRGEQGNKLSVFFDRLALILPGRLPGKDPSATGAGRKPSRFSKPNRNSRKGWLGLAVEAATVADPTPINPCAFSNFGPTYAERSREVYAAASRHPASRPYGGWSAKIPRSIRGHARGPNRGGLYGMCP